MEKVVKSILLKLETGLKKQRTDAQFNLGIMLNEDGDAAAAKRWFQEAAAQGNAVGRRWNVC